MLFVSSDSGTNVSLGSKQYQKAAVHLVELANEVELLNHAGGHVADEKDDHRRRLDKLRCNRLPVGGMSQQNFGFVTHI